MIHLTSHLNSVTIAINPAQVTMVVESQQGCIVHFVGENKIHVANNYLEVVASVSSGLK